MVTKECIVVLLIEILNTFFVQAIPKPEEQQNHLGHDSARAMHYQDGIHNAEYDHEAFLGEDEVKTFEQLPPGESRRRLGIIVEKIDENKDGFVDKSELKKWIEYTQRRYIDEDVGRVWKQQKAENEKINWEVYRINVYGFLDETDSKESDKIENGIMYQEIMIRDRRRWANADQDGDGYLTREEFTAFLHPENNPLMREIVLTETIEDIDQDKDEKISVEEYIKDMYRSSDPVDEEPEWVKRERDSFVKFRDTNNDGFLDREEVRSWIAPKGFDHAEAEAKHLIYEADEDNDEKLTMGEILEKYDVFVGSQATDFGEALGRHDEF